MRMVDNIKTGVLATAVWGLIIVLIAGGTFVLTLGVEVFGGVIITCTAILGSGVLVMLWRAIFVVVEEIM